MSSVFVGAQLRDTAGDVHPRRNSFLDASLNIPRLPVRRKHKHSLERWKDAQSSIRLRAFAYLTVYTQRSWFAYCIYTLIGINMLAPFITFLHHKVWLPALLDIEHNVHFHRREDAVLITNLAISIFYGFRNFLLFLFGIGAVKSRSLMISLTLDVAVWVAGIVSWVYALQIDEWTDDNLFVLSVAGLLAAIQLNTFMITNAMLNPLVRARKASKRRRETQQETVPSSLVERLINEASIEEEHKIILKHELLAVHWTWKKEDSKRRDLELGPVRLFHFTHKAAEWVQRWERSGKDQAELYDLLHKLQFFRLVEMHKRETLDAAGLDVAEQENAKSTKSMEEENSPAEATVLSIKYLIHGQKLRALAMVVLLCAIAWTQFAFYWVIGELVDVASAMWEEEQRHADHGVTQHHNSHQGHGAASHGYKSHEYHDLRNRFIYLQIVITMLVVVNVFAYYLTSNIGSRLISNATARLQSEIAKRVLYADKNFEEAFDPGFLSSAYSASLAKLETIWNELWYSLVLPVACLVGAVIFCCLVDVGYAMFAVVSVPLLFCTKSLLGDRAGKASEEFTASSARLLSRFQNVVRLRKASQVYESQDFLSQRLNERVLETQQKNFSSLLWGNVFYAVFSSVGSFVILVACIVLLVALSRGQISAGEFFSFFNFVYGIIRPLEALGLMSGRVAYLSGAVFTVESVLQFNAEDGTEDEKENDTLDDTTSEVSKTFKMDQPSQHKHDFLSRPFDEKDDDDDEETENDEENPSPKPKSKQSLSSSSSLTLDDKMTFRNVGFSYRPELPPVLTSISADILAGTYVGIFGPSGSGKSTLLALVEGFHSCTTGSIYMDGVDIDSVSRKKLHEKLGVVFQETFVLDGTIRENIAFGCKHDSLQEVIQAAKDAQIHDFIESLPKKYDTLIGLESTTSLSGGQLQRICGLARALIRKPSLLILDEATSALDTISEQTVIDTILSLREQQGMTTLSVSHHPNTVQDADKIIVLGRDGKINQSGTYQELVTQKDGLFAELVEAGGG